MNPSCDFYEWSFTNSPDSDESSPMVINTRDIEWILPPNTEYDGQSTKRVRVKFKWSGEPLPIIHSYKYIKKALNIHVE